MAIEQWCGFNGWQPLVHTYDGAAYMAPIQANEEAWSKIKETISNAKPGEFYTFDADGNASIAIGDTPEQSVDGIIIDGAIVTREDVRRLQSELDALAAQVEALQQSLLKCAELVNFDGGTAIDWLIDNCYDLRRQAKATPQQHLRDVRAEAGRDGFIAGYFHYKNYGFQFEEELEAASNQYAERVKAV